MHHRVHKKRNREMSVKIGIIGAMDVEIARLRDQMKIERSLEKARMTFLEGMIGDTEVVVVKSGIGKVNAAICVQILADTFNITHVINTGIAGSLDSKINIGDIVVSEDACYHDVDATIFGYAPGEIPQLGVKSFKADPDLRKKAVEAIRSADPDLGVFEGRIISGDQFIGGNLSKERLNSFNALCTEMEGAGIAQAAYLNHLPFVIIRAISDKADGSAEVDYPAFEKKAAEDCARLVINFIKNF